MSLHLMLATWQKDTPPEVLSAATGAIAASAGCYARFDLGDPDDESELRELMESRLPAQAQVVLGSIVGSPTGTEATDLWIESRATAIEVLARWGQALPAQQGDVTQKRDWPTDYDRLVRATRLGRFLGGIAQFGQSVDLCLTVFDEGGVERLVSDSPDDIALSILRQIVLPWDCVEYRAYHFCPQQHPR